jgi:hypothetical protein
MNGDPLPWLLDEETPAVRHLALRWLLGEPENSASTRRARVAAMRADPIAATLAAQHPEGYWVRPGAGYGPKYTGTVWSLMFLDLLGADPHESGIQRACAYVLEHAQAPNGGHPNPTRAPSKPRGPRGPRSRQEPRLAHAIEVVLSKQDDSGRWRNEHAYERMTWVPVERTRSPSKWVTLRACRVLKAAHG